MCNCDSISNNIASFLEFRLIQFKTNQVRIYSTKIYNSDDFEEFDNISIIIINISEMLKQSYKPSVAAIVISYLF